MPNDESMFRSTDLLIRPTRICVTVFAYLEYLYLDIVIYTMINIHPAHHNPESNSVSQDTTSTLLTHAICKRR